MGVHRLSPLAARYDLVCLRNPVVCGEMASEIVENKLVWKTQLSFCCGIYVRQRGGLYSCFNSISSSSDKHKNSRLDITVRIDKRAATLTRVLSTTLG